MIIDPDAGEMAEMIASIHDGARPATILVATPRGAMYVRAGIDYLISQGLPRIPAIAVSIARSRPF